MRIPALNEWIETLNKDSDQKVIFGDFDRVKITPLPPLQGVSIDSVIVLN
jgi:hypothetical protein